MQLRRRLMKRMLLLLRWLLQCLQVRSRWRMWIMRRQPGRLLLLLLWPRSRLLRIGSQGGVLRRGLPEEGERRGRTGAVCDEGWRLMLLGGCAGSGEGAVELCCGQQGVRMR
jgi:hypothetical protein